MTIEFTKSVIAFLPSKLRRSFLFVGWRLLQCLSHHANVTDPSFKKGAFIEPEFASLGDVGFITEFAVSEMF